MGLSIAGSPNFSSIMELVDAKGQEGEGTEGIEALDEGANPEMAKNSEGSLSGTGRQFACTPQMRSSLPEKVTTDYLADINRPKETKPIGLKSSNHLSFKESVIKEKEFKVLQPHKPNLEGAKQQTEPKVFAKSDQIARQALAKGEAPPSAKNLNENPAAKQQQNFAKTIEQRVQKEYGEKESRKTTHADREKTESKKQARENEREKETTHSSLQRLDKNEEGEQEHSKKQNRDDEEEFAEGQQGGQQQEHADEDGKRVPSIEKTREKRIKEIESYGLEESILSEIFNMRVSQFDVLLLFIEIMKLDIRSRELERHARRQERELQLMHMQNVVENFKSQASFIFSTSLGAGVLGIAAGALPIIGQMKGEWILEKLSSIKFFNLQDAKPNQFFKRLGEIAHAMSDVQKSTGQVFTLHADGSRTFDQHMSELHKSDWEENTRVMEEIKDNWKGIENFLYQTLQMYHDSIRQLYN